MNNTEEKQTKKAKLKIQYKILLCCYNQGIQQMRHCDQIKNNIALLQV